MARLLIQSKSTGRFLVPGDDGQPEWTGDLKRAGGGVVFDPDTAFQLISDHTDFDDQPQVIDLDRLGTANDYTH